MKITTIDIIRFLPLQKEMKDKLSANWESYTNDVKFELEQLLWDAYDSLYDLTLEENIRLELLRAEKEEVKLDDEFYNRMREKTDKQMQQEQHTQVDSEELSVIRSKLEAFMGPS